MKHHTLSYSCILNASVQDVCHFHTDTHNLPLITPPWIDVTIESMDEPFIEKSRVTLLIKRFGIPTRWVMEIEVLDCPHTVIDKMVSGPFSFFRHQRHFVPLNEKTTRMDEAITLHLPLGWVGLLLFPLIKRDMDKMFAYRHHATQEYFDKQTN